MKIFNNIKHIFENRYDPSVERHFSAIMWYLVIRITLITLVLFLLAGIFLWWYANGGVESTDTGVSSVNTISREKLSELLNTIGEREVKYRGIKDSPTSIIDPALKSR